MRGGFSTRDDLEPFLEQISKNGVSKRLYFVYCWDGELLTFEVTKDSYLDREGLREINFVNPGKFGKRCWCSLPVSSLVMYDNYWLALAASLRIKHGLDKPSE